MNCRFRMRRKALWKCRKIKVKKNTLVFVDGWKSPPKIIKIVLREGGVCNVTDVVQAR